jgi:hypothetical protein
LHSVDLPAPFSPSRQWISPGAMSIETSASACRLPKRLDMPRSDSSGAAGTGAGVSAGRSTVATSKAFSLRGP